MRSKAQSPPPITLPALTLTTLIGDCSLLKKDFCQEAIANSAPALLENSRQVGHVLLVDHFPYNHKPILCCHNTYR